MCRKVAFGLDLKELWQLFPIILVAPDPLWKEMAAEEIAFLSEKLRGRFIAIHHIGSTAIAGIWSKPIIDIIVEVDADTRFVAIKEELTRCGYLCMALSLHRQSFNKGYTPEGFADKVFHVHVRRKGDTNEIYFRDYLNAHPEVAKQYEALKLSLWKPYEHDRDGYTQAKSAFVTHYTELAKLNDN